MSLAIARPEATALPAAVRAVLAALRAAGFREAKMRRFWPGAVTLHTGRG